MTSHRSRRPHAVVVRSLSAAALVVLAGCASEPAAPSPADTEAPLPQVSASVRSGPPEFVAGEMIVKFRAGATTVARARVMRGARAALRERILTASMRRRGDTDGIQVLQTDLDVTTAVASMLSDPDVEYAEPNWVYHHEAVSNDPYVTNGSLWGMGSGFGTQAVTAWANNKTNCSGVYVGIIDEGYMYTHADLAANVGVNPGEIAGNGVDDDGNGLRDDVYGWDFAANNASVFDGLNDDHGTHVAGTIGGVGGNGQGVAGMCWRVKLLDAKFLGTNGGTTANAIKAVDYFTNLKLRGVNIVATNNSWGGGGFSQGLQDAIERANAAGILFVAAAGNSTLNCETSACYPAEYPNANIIAVASITSTGAISSFSNYGVTTIDIGAPGSGIFSSVPSGNRRNIMSGYASYSGTSMATPHVTGAAALYAATHPGATAAQIKAAILSSATPTPSLAGRTLTGGRLNVSGF
ncbi:MAG: S8 family serine peptidase [Gemmatimonadaceae bacterium]|nr:S8 family serine peptidase [Gemmatimonadaceae bacterium]